MQQKVIHIGMALLCLSIAAISFYKGPILTLDSKEFIKYANQLPTQLPQIPLSYSLLVYIIGIIHLIFGQTWADYIVGINVICTGAALILAFTLLKNFTSTIFSMVFFLTLVLLCNDLILWNAYILSDSIYAALNFFVFFSIYKMIIVPDKKHRYLPLFIACFILSCITRPTAIALIVFSMFTSLSLLLGKTKFKNNLAGLSGLLLFFGVLGYVGFICLWSYYWSTLPQTAVPQGLSFVKTFYLKGIVIMNRPETYHLPVQDFWDYLIITLTRFIRFFQFIVTGELGFSLKHNLLNAVFYTITYLFGLFAFYRALTKELPFQHWALIWMSVIFIASYAAFHSITFVDFDFRYRLPIMLPLILMATVGFHYFTETYFRRTNQSLASLQSLDKNTMYW